MFDETRLDRLISAYFDHQLTAEEKAEFEAMLLASSRARQIFTEQSQMHGLTREWALQSQAAHLMGNAIAPLPSISTASKNIIPFRKIFLIGAGLAACLAIGWKLIPSKVEHTASPGMARPKPLSADVALLAQAVNVEWEKGSIEYIAGSALPQGTLAIRKGTLRLDFYSGARLVLEGPASIDLLSPDLARLDHGKLMAHVPPPAKGFAVLAGDLKVVDRGTEFGMSVLNRNDTEVHVFQGEIELQGNLPANGKHLLLKNEAASIRHGKWNTFAADRQFFADPAAMRQAAEMEAEARWESWRAASQTFRRTPDLLVHFDFENIDPGSMLLPNTAIGASESSNGTIIGCEVLSGRWSRKSALGFTSTSDRVRFRMEGKTRSLTLMAWVRVDSLPQDHNALFSMSPDVVGEVHWKLDKHGCLLIGLRASPQFAYQSWERLASPKIVNPEDFGRWVHLATVIDGDAGVMRHYVNGDEVASGSMKRRPKIQLGLANIGNFDESGMDRPPINEVHSFNGRVDEFAAFSRALSPTEIAALK